MMYAKQDVYSYNRTQYCTVNDPLTIIHSDGLIAIVETAKGNRFPCLVELLSENEVVVLVEEEVKEEPIAQLKLW